MSVLNLSRKWGNECEATSFFYGFSSNFPWCVFCSNVLSSLYHNSKFLEGRHLWWPACPCGCRPGCCRSCGPAPCCWGGRWRHWSRRSSPYGRCCLPPPKEPKQQSLSRFQHQGTNFSLPQKKRSTLQLTVVLVVAKILPDVPYAKVVDASAVLSLASISVLKSLLLVHRAIIATHILFLYLY